MMPHYTLWNYLHAAHVTALDLSPGLSEQDAIDAMHTLVWLGASCHESNEVQAQMCTEGQSRGLHAFQLA